MKKLIACILVTIVSLNAKAQLHKSKDEVSFISFSSKSPLENIEATNKKATVVIRTSTNDIQVGVPMLGFKFTQPLMEEHFNENYVESDKYPTCTFKGKIIEALDYTKDGEHKVTAKGTLDLHGVQKEIEATGTITIKNQQIHVVSGFKIKLTDYNIKVPSLYIKNIAEEVDVKIDALLEPFVKK